MKIVTLLLDQKLSLEVWVEEQGKEQTPSASNNSSIFRSRLIFYILNQLDAFYVKCTYLLPATTSNIPILRTIPSSFSVLLRHCPMKRQCNNWQIATIALVYCVFFTDVFIDFFSFCTHTLSVGLVYLVPIL